MAPLFVDATSLLINGVHFCMPLMPSKIDWDFGANFAGSPTVLLDQSEPSILTILPIGRLHIQLQICNLGRGI
jgi:hypothetical protein